MGYRPRWFWVRVRWPRNPVKGFHPDFAKSRRTGARTLSSWCFCSSDDTISQKNSFHMDAKGYGSIDWLVFNFWRIIDRMRVSQIWRRVVIQFDMGATTTETEYVDCHPGNAEFTTWSLCIFLLSSLLSDELRTQKVETKTFAKFYKPKTLKQSETLSKLCSISRVWPIF